MSSNKTAQILDDERLNLLMKPTGQINSNVDLDDMLFGIINVELEEGRVTLKPGQQIVIYSDGISEPQNANGDLYEEVRLKDWLLNHPDRTPEETIEQLIEDVKAFSASDKQNDDITLIVIKRSES